MGELQEIARAVLEKAEERREKLTSLLCEFVGIRSLPGGEGKLAEAIKKSLIEAGADSVFVDPLGNCIGTIGDGPIHLVYDGHMDTVDAGDLGNWEIDPFKPVVRDGKIYGRGSADQKGGIASAVVALSIINELGIPDRFKISVVASVLEEPREGVAWQYIVEDDGIKPDFVVITEPSSLRIMRGHLGRAEFEIIIRGRSAHGSMPEKGVNAIELMVPVLQELFELSGKLREHPVLGKGRLTVTEVKTRSPSLCAVPDIAVVHIDRRLTLGEDEESALEELRNLESVKKINAEVKPVREALRSYTGLLCTKKPLYPPWLMDEEHPLISAAKDAYRNLFRSEPKVDVWKFSTNGVATCGIYGIPTVGFGPGDPSLAHTPMEYCPIDDIVKAAAFYAALPYFLKQQKI